MSQFRGAILLRGTFLRCDEVLTINNNVSFVVLDRDEAHLHTLRIILDEALVQLAMSSTSATQLMMREEERIVGMVANVWNEHWTFHLLRRHNDGRICGFKRAILYYFRRFSSFLVAPPEHTHTTSSKFRHPVGQRIVDLLRGVIMRAMPRHLEWH